VPGVVDWSAFGDVDTTRPGRVVAVVRDGRTDVWRSLGAEAPEGAPLNTESVLYVASIAKQFTAACVALLVLDGTVSLDDDVRSWLPELQRYESTVRLRHLLAHTSGLPSSNPGDDAAGRGFEDPVTIADRVAFIATLELDHEPGSMHQYSNHGYVLLAEVVRRATGSSLGAVARERIFQPLSMSSTTFLDVEQPTIVPGWAGGQRRVDIRTSCVGDGGLVTCVEDLARWDYSLPRSELAALMLRDRPAMPDGTWAHDAWGISLRTHHGQRIESHGGSVQGHLASFVRFPDLDVSFVALANSDEWGVAGFGYQLRAFVWALLGDALDPELPPWGQTHGIPVGR
jgi:CubicO group peptidase (beta-lactamase class C family)